MTMNIEEEINTFYAGQALLEAAVKAKAEFDALTDKYEAILEDLGNCNHPPFTKAGKHDKRVFCNTCFDEHQKLMQAAYGISSAWAGAWELLADLASDAK